MKDCNHRVVEIVIIPYQRLESPRIKYCNWSVYCVGLGLRILFAGHGAYRVVCGVNSRLAGSRPLTAPLVVSLPIL